MIKYLTLKILNVFDFFHQRRIIKYLHKKGFKSFDNILDVGAHKGESINLFLSNFKTKTIYSFEASPMTFKILSDKIDYFRNKFKNSKIIIKQLEDSHHILRQGDYKTIQQITELALSRLR